MPHSFTITLSDEISAVLQRVESEITGKGGSFMCNTERGSFAGRSLLGVIKGEYRGTAENEIRITITDKPFAVPYGMIESEIKKYFS
jgi:hypothetical protein